MVLVMKSVGVKQLKARLSEYLRVVRAGETVLVTDRDEVVAELRTARPRAASPQSLEEILDSLSERGDLTRAAIAKGRWTWKIKGLGLSPGSAAALLDELRRDR
jgi:prevent-host-death family protein